MNVPYTEINTREAAKRIGLEYSTISKWCQQGLIKCINIGSGISKNRYMLTEKEVEYLRSLNKKYGRKNVLKHYDKNWDVPEVVYQNEECEIFQEPVEESKEEELPTRKPFDLDSITTTISYIQDIKDRLSQLDKEKHELTEKLNDLDAEYNQLTNEYAELREEVIGIL